MYVYVPVFMCMHRVHVHAHICTNVYLGMFNGKILINQYFNNKNLTNRDDFVKKLFCRAIQSYLHWIKHNISCFLLNNWKISLEKSK